MSIKDLYESKTVSGHDYEISQFDSELVVGAIKYAGFNQKDLAVDWKIDSNNYDLACRSGEAYSVKRRSPIWDTQCSNRLLNDVFIISTIRPALVFYTIQLTVSLALSGTAEKTVSLIVGHNSQFSITSTIQNSLTMELLPGVTQTSTMQYVLSGFVPIGAAVKLLTSEGSGTATLINAFEVLL